MELDPKYATVIVKRFIMQVGSDEDAYLLRDGVKIPYADVPKPEVGVGEDQPADIAL